MINELEIDMRDRITIWGPWFLIAAVIGFLITLTGCSSAQRIKNDIIQDLQTIADKSGDCPTTCEALKLYIKAQLGSL